MATTNKGLNQPVIGSGSWGDPLNENAGYLDAALGGVTTISVTGVTATPVPLTIAQYRNLIIKFNGVLTANVTYQVPSGVGGQWTVENSATGAFTITIASLGGGTSGVVSSGSLFVTSDGTNIRTLAPLPSGVTATAADLNILSGQSASGLTSTELGYVNGVTSPIQTQINALNGIPSGSVIYFAANAAPSGFLKANGAVVSRTTYAALFAAIGTTFGVGDGSTTFGLPDLRGEFLRGWDDGRGVDTGRVFGSLQAQAIESHTHSVNDPGHNHGTNASRWGTGSQGLTGGSNNLLAASNISAVTGITINAAGGTETRPRNVALLACIKF